ncbi:hypothetical protein BKP54_02575 [Ensifer sp. 1H6]|nr:hypothetical protein BKP54_02575 [Ensifer sp. 1H6]
MAAVVAFHCGVPVALGGMIGVDLFFVLSGYLVTTILREGRSLLEFFAGRIVRLCPALFLMLAVYAAVAPWFLLDRNVTSDVLLAGLYVSDYSMAFWHEPLMLNHTWSLAVEAKFYLLWPFLIVATRSIKQEALLWVLGVAFLLATAWRVIDCYVWQDWYRSYYRFDTRTSGLILGGMLAVMPWRPTGEQAAKIGRYSIYVLLVALIFFRFRHIGIIAWGGIVVDLAAACLILSLISGETPVSRFLSRHWMRHLGLWSYSIYLWHYPITRALRGEWGPIPTFIVVGLLSIGLASLSYSYVEQPMRALFRRRKATA